MSSPDVPPTGGSGGGGGISWGKQVGPLPMGAWVAVIGGALAIAAFAAYMKRNKGGVEIVEDISGEEGVGTGSGSMWIQTNPPPEAMGGKAVTNEEWGRNAINYLIAQGYDPALADTAIRKYLESTPLTLAENSMVKLALTKFGSPPVPLPAPPDQPTPPGPTPTPTPTPTPPQNGQRWAYVTPWPTRFSTLWGISSYYYGSGKEYPRIYNANRVGVTRPDGTPGFIRNPDLIYAGARLYIP